MANDTIFLGNSPNGSQHLLLSRANRHGLIAGATGTGKTVSLQVLAETFSAAGTSVFAADVKGDLAGLAMPGSNAHPAHDALQKRAVELGMDDFSYADNHVIFWDLYGERGHPIRTTVSEMGPVLLARLLNLNETQEGVLNIAFRVADEDGLLLLNLDDLQALLAFCAEKASELTARFGNVTNASVGAIQRQLLQLDSQGGDKFFGEPALDITDFMHTDEQGRGAINILAADRLLQNPRLYSTFLLWLLSELFEELPEIGDPPRPKLVFFFDEAHLLFEEAPKALLEKIEQVVRLIRSKGVGVYFVTQNPVDIPDKVAAQLGNRVQHALRAFTPKEQKAIEAAAETFRPNPGVDVASAITELRTGEALVSVIDDKGVPIPVERTLIRPPSSRLGPLTEKERAIIRSISPIEKQYDETVDRESAYEILKAQAERAASETQAVQAAVAAEKERVRVERERARNRPLHEDLLRQVGKSMQRQVSNRIASKIVRGVLGGLFKGR